MRQPGMLSMSPSTHTQWETPGVFCRSGVPGMSLLLTNRFAAVVTSGVSHRGLRDVGEGSPSSDLWGHWS
jgi:hypothetical protein